MVESATLPGLARMLRQLKRREARRRGDAELTYRVLAGKTGWSAGIIAHYFTGKTLAPTDRFDILVRLLGASPAEQGALATVRDRLDEQRRQPASRSAGPSAHIRLLGQVEIAGPHGMASLSGARQRALIGLLGLCAGMVLSQDRLIDGLWGDTPPRTATRTLHAHIARLRKALDSCGLTGVLLTRSRGYLLDLRPDQVDASRFEDLAAQGHRALAKDLPKEAVTNIVACLDLWRGTAFEDARAEGWAAAHLRRLDEVRVGAIEDLWDARLRLGEHASSVQELARLVTAYPGRERLVGSYMLALYRSGWAARAIAAYEQATAHLGSELGVKPGPALQRMHSAILRAEPWLDHGAPQVATADLPAQLPPRPGHFTGRKRELATLNTLLPEPWRIGVLSGQGGMGKTALAVHWAYGVSVKFPDGQLFLDLRGHDPGVAMPAAEALNHLLRGMGIPAGQLPNDLAAQVALYRSALHKRQMLIMLDNAGSVEQLTPLVPPGNSSLLIVTSRHQLAGLDVGHEAVRVRLDVLPEDDATVLLGSVLGTARTQAEGIAAGQLAQLCGRMPLALRIAAAKLAARPHWPIAEFVADLAGQDRLGVLTLAGGSHSVRAVFASACRALSPPAASLFRQLACLPGPTFTSYLASAITPSAREALQELAAAHLVSEADKGRYQQHDLIRLYGAESAGHEEQQTLITQTISWYLALAGLASKLLEPARDRVTLSINLPPEAMPPAGNTVDLLAFLDAERSNLTELTSYAADHGHAQAAWQLTYLLTSFYTHRGYWPEQLVMCRHGLRAAMQLSDPVAERLMRSGLGVACNATGRYQEALEHLSRTLTLMQAGGDRRGQAMALNNMALAHGRLGQLGAAAAMFEQARQLCADDGYLPGVALALSNLGDIYSTLGQATLAFEQLQLALALARDLDNSHLEGAVQQNLGEACLACGDEDGALGHFTLALAIRSRNGERRREADTSNAIGLLHAARGDNGNAKLHFGRALTLSRELADSSLEAITLSHLSGCGASIGTSSEL